MKELKILIIDDEAVILKELRNFLELVGFTVYEADSPSKAFASLETTPIDVVLLDVRLPEMSGLQVLEQIKVIRPDLEVLMMSGHGDMDTVTQALRGGAFDFFRKPLDGSQITAAIERTKKYLKLKNDLERVKRRYAPFSEEMEKKVGNIIGDSPEIRRVIELTLKAAKATDTSVLIEGESGTGKELIARVIHFASPRAEGPFQPVNCSAIPENLVESEFFGHRKGAFTGAVEDRMGTFEAAHRGTLFLDEVGDLPLPAQAKLLRVLETRLVRRLGTTRDIPVDVRVVCATHRNLKKMIPEGTFREDLFYRLSTFSLAMPPLRERKKDIAALLSHYAELFAKRLGQQGPAIDPRVAASLENYAFPGNIRELKNMVERAVILADGSPLLPEHFSHPAAAPQTIAELEPEADITLDLATREKKDILKALQANQFNRTKTAHILGISIYTLIRRMKKYKIQPGQET